MKWKTNANMCNILCTLLLLQNIGELTATDVDKVIQYGRDVRGLAKRFEEHDRAVAIPAKVGWCFVKWQNLKI